MKKCENRSEMNLSSTAAPRYFTSCFAERYRPFRKRLYCRVFCHMLLARAALRSTKPSIDWERMRLLVHQTNRSAAQKLFINSFFLATLIHNDEILICNSNFFFFFFFSKIVLRPRIDPRAVGMLPCQLLNSSCNTEKYTYLRNAIVKHVPIQNKQLKHNSKITYFS